MTDTKDDGAASRATPANHDLVDEARTYVERMRNDQIKDLGCGDSYEFGLIGALANEVERLEKVARFNTDRAFRSACIDEIEARLNAIDCGPKSAAEWYDSRLLQTQNELIFDAPDADFIAAAPGDIGFLLSEVKRLERYESFVNRNGDILADFVNQEAT